MTPTVDDRLSQAELSIHAARALLSNPPRKRQYLTWHKTIRSHLWQAQVSIYPLIAEFGVIRQGASEAEKRRAKLMSVEIRALQRETDRSRK